MAIASVGLVVDVVVTAVGCIYIWQKSTSDPALKVALIGDVVAGSAGVIGIVAAIIAVATYAATGGAPTLKYRVRVGDGAEVTPADGQSVLRVACESPQAGIRKLMLDPLLEGTVFVHRGDEHGRLHRRQYLLSSSDDAPNWVAASSAWLESGGARAGLVTFLRVGWRRPQHH